MEGPLTSRMVCWLPVGKLELAQQLASSIKLHEVALALAHAAVDDIDCGDELQKAMAASSSSCGSSASRQ